MSGHDRLKLGEADAIDESVMVSSLYKHIDHVALVVQDIERAADFYRNAFQLDLIMGLSYPPDGVHTNLVFSLGDENELELMGPLGDSGFIMEFLRKNGEGVHHLAMEVTDIELATQRVEKNGVRIFGRSEFKGMRFTFLHPGSTLRVGMQLMQRKAQKPSRNPLIKGIDHIALRVSNPVIGHDFFLRQLEVPYIATAKDPILDCTCDQFMVGRTPFNLLYDFAGSSPSGQTDGIHHLAVKVNDLPEAVRHFKQWDIEPVARWSDEKSVFLPPAKMHGCLWRVVQR